jgi:hypothetical protein
VVQYFARLEWFNILQGYGEPNSETSRPQDHMDECGERCSDDVVGNALIHHSTIAECDHTQASYVDTRFAHHSQVASQGTGAVNVRIADMAMY